MIWLFVITGTRIGQASECFVYWKDPVTNDTWGLNFTSPADARAFRECCVSSIAHLLLLLFPRPVQLCRQLIRARCARIEEANRGEMGRLPRKDKEKSDGGGRRRRNLSEDKKEKKRTCVELVERQIRCCSCGSIRCDGPHHEEEEEV